MEIWSQELSEYGIEFQPRVVIKCQAVVYFVAEFTYEVNMEEDDGEGEKG